ncbi:MaoC/PaaZ C-terminal domain-containing protein [Actinocorallia cavernae]|uniref:MaoC/PaaZ C-terminal domain-containing protein n=2 Tax=Actinomycetes TaxID=1760 RepID=A0ABN3MZT6_9ACTN
MSTVLDKSPALGPVLAAGALRSLGKRSSAGAPHPDIRLVLPGVRADPARLARYARLCAFPAPCEHLPLPYPHVLAFPLAMRLLGARDFPLPLLGLVHTSIELARHAPLPVSESYELTVYVSGLAPHRRGTEATVVAEARLAGEPVWESRSTYLSRHRTAGEAAPASLPEPPDPLPPLASWDLPGDLGRAYAAASGDRNPIHLTRLTARLFGFPRAIAHGMWTAARCLAEHGDVRAARVEFRAPVLLPGVVRYGASPEGDRFELRGADGRVHVSGRVSEAP